MTLPTAVPALSLLCLALLAGCAIAPSSEVKTQLAPSGALRVAVLTSNPIIDAAGVGGDVKVAPPD